MLYYPTDNHCELDRSNVPSKEERCAQLMELDTTIHKVRAALSALGRQLGQLLVTRHNFGRDFGKMSEIMRLEELIATVECSPKPFGIVSIASALKS